MFEATRESLDEYGAIRPAAWLLWIGVAGELRTGLEESGLEQLEIGEAPDLIRGAGGLEDAHRGVGGKRAIDLRQHDDAVRTVKDAGMRGIGSAGTAQIFSLLIQLD